MKRHYVLLFLFGLQSIVLFASETAPTSGSSKSGKKIQNPISIGKFGKAYDHYDDSDTSSSKSISFVDSQKKYDEFREGEKEKKGSFKITNQRKGNIEAENRLHEETRLSELKNQLSH